MENTTQLRCSFCNLFLFYFIYLKKFGDGGLFYALFFPSVTVVFARRLRHQEVYVNKIASYVHVGFSQVSFVKAASCSFRDCYD